MLNKRTVQLNENEKIELRKVMSPYSRLKDILNYVGVIPPKILKKHKNTKNASNFLTKFYLTVEVNRFHDNTNWVKFYKTPDGFMAEYYENPLTISPRLQKYNSVEDILKEFIDIHIFKIDIVQLVYITHNIYDCGGRIRPSRNSSKQCVRDEYDRVDKKQIPIGALKFKRF